MLRRAVNAVVHSLPSLLSSGTLIMRHHTRSQIRGLEIVLTRAQCGPLRAQAYAGFFMIFFLHWKLVVFKFKIVHELRKTQRYKPGFEPNLTKLKHELSLLSILSNVVTYLLFLSTIRFPIEVLTATFRQSKRVRSCPNERVSPSLSRRGPKTDPAVYLSCTRDIITEHPAGGRGIVLLRNGLFGNTAVRGTSRRLQGGGREPPLLNRVVPSLDFNLLSVFRGSHVEIPTRIWIRYWYGYLGFILQLNVL